MYLWKFHTWKEKSRLITVYLFAFKKSLLPWPRGTKQFPIGKKKNGPCFPKCGCWTEGSWMGQRGTLSLKHFIDHVAHPLIFNALYILVQRGFVLVNLLVQHHSVKTLGMNRPNAKCSMQCCELNASSVIFNLNATTLISSEEKSICITLKVVRCW